MSLKSLTMAAAAAACCLLTGALAEPGSAPARTKAGQARSAPATPGKKATAKARTKAAAARKRRAARAARAAQAAKTMSAPTSPASAVTAPSATPAPAVGDVVAPTIAEVVASAPAVQEDVPLPAPAPEAAPRLFAATSFWNRRLADDAPVDARSGVFVGEIQQQLTRWSPYINTTRYSAPVYTVDAAQPKVGVALDSAGSDLRAAFEHVPVPDDARPADGTDGHLVVWQPSTDTMWEMWRARRVDGVWRAAYGGRMTEVSQNPGYFTDHSLWGATATSLPLLGGLIRIDELRAGRIDHALAIALPELRAGVFRWPAQRTDGRISSDTAIPAGTRFRIPAAVNLAAMNLSPLVRTLATAAQRYGIVVRDTAGAVTFFAEDPTPLGENPYLGTAGLFGGPYVSELLRRFPWGQLEALGPPV